eukprot:3409855-Karenia_brevis.AAC.1
MLVWLHNMRDANVSERICLRKSEDIDDRLKRLASEMEDAREPAGNEAKKPADKETKTAAPEELGQEGQHASEAKQEMVKRDLKFAQQIARIEAEAIAACEREIAPMTDELAAYESQVQDVDKQVRNAVLG